MKEQHVVIITGMHRTGTSLVSSLLQKAGVHIGDDLVGSHKGNPRGHFEDVDFNHFHERILHRCGQTHLVQSTTALDKIIPTEAETEEALGLIRQRSDRELWSWKDPRTSLFLKFWHDLLPQARYLFIYRHPIEVVLSLLRRGMDLDLNALVDPMVGVRTWEVYNQSILDFYQRYPESCLLCHISGITADIEAFIDLTARKLDLPLRKEGTQLLYHPTELKQIASLAEANSIFEHIMPEAAKLYEQLEAQADLPSQGSGQIVVEKTPRLAGLQQAVSILASHDMLRKDQIAHHFSLLLTLLAPQTVLAGKEALDKIRIDHIGSLEQLVASKEEQIQDLAAHASNLEQHLQESITHAKNLKQLLESKEQLLESKDEYLRELATHAKNLEQLVASKEALTRNLEQRIAAMERTITWRLASKLYAFYRPVSRLGKRLLAAGVKPADTDNYLRQSQNLTPKVLFISHDALRAGAPIVLLNLLKWFKANTDIPFEILLKDGYGELGPEFEALAPVIAWNESGPVNAKEHLEQANIGLIYSNTITNGEVLAALSNLKCPVISHVHELEYWINYRVEPENLKQVQKYTHHYIVVSQAVKQNLVENLKISEDKIDVVYEFIPTTQSGLSQKQNRIRQQLNIPQEAFVVGACGTTDWRKGPDLFIQLTRAVYQRQPEKPVHFVWVGGESEGPDFGALWHDVKRTGLGEYIHFVGKRPNPLDYFATFDVFAMVSREDPFPLVNLEAALLGKPIVCFDGSGGSKEFVESDCGFVVPYLDIETMADRLIDLLNSPELRQRFGQQAVKKVRERHDVAIAAPKLVGIIERFLLGKNGGP